MSSLTTVDLRRSYGLGALPLGLFLGTLCLAYWMARQIAVEQYRNVLVAAVLAQLIWVFLRWRWSVYGLVVYVVLEGFFVNYFSTVPELNLVKDALVIGLFASLAATLLSRGMQPIPSLPWMAPFLAFAVLYFAEIFNPNLPNIFVGLVGVRVTLLYFLVVPIAYWFFESKQRVLNFLLFFSLLSVPVSLFGLVQYWKGPEWIVSLSPGFGRAVYYASGINPSIESFYFRTFSTFVHTGGFAQHLFLVLLLSLPLWILPAFRRHRWWVGAAFVLHFVALLTTGGRSSFVMFIAAVAVLFFMLRGSAKIVPVMMVLPLVLWGSSLFVGPQFVERFESVLNLEYVSARNRPLMIGWLEGSMEAPWTGLGAGYATVASRHAGATALNGGVLENGLAKMRYEAGLPGLALYILFLLTVILDCLRAPFRIRDPELRWCVAACASFLTINLANVVLGPVFDASPNNIYLWFLLGLVARARHLETPPVAEQAASQQTV